MLAAGDDRQHAGNEGYDDDPQRHYSWDSTVANHSRPKAGDVIALWDKKILLGASIIESIVEGDDTKVRLRCPVCSKTKIKMRRMAPKYRCFEQSCKAEFREPVQERVDVHNYRTSHEAAWVYLEGLLDAVRLRPLCIEPKSQQSIRELKLEEFHEALQSAGAGAEIAMLARVQQRFGQSKGPLTTHGHSMTTVRVRNGQGAFRKALLNSYDSVCALTGQQPVHVLEAAHLYRYSELGRHHEDGGLLLRRDLHRLFDLGLIAIDPATGVIDVTAELRRYEDYAALHLRTLAVQLPEGARRWLKLHWEQHRGSRAAG